MFSPRSVQADVKERLELLKNVDEETIHRVYLAIMFEHLEGARSAVRSVRVYAEQRRASHPTQGWIMVSREQQSELDKLLDECT